MKALLSLIIVALASHAWADNHHAPELKEFKATEIAPGITMLQGKGGNIMTLKGKEGLLVIDDDYADNIALLEKTLNEMGGTQYLINTHWHGDHTGGNEVLGEEATIVAHENVRVRLSSPQEVKLFGMKTEAHPEVALPEVTYDKNMSIHFAGQHVKISHFPSGHTDGDSVVFVEPANIVHMGDHYFSGMYPFVDVENGGDVKGMARNIAAILDMIEDDTVVVPGHGAISNKKELSGFLKMLAGTTDEVQKMKGKGMSLEKIQEKGLSSQWEAWGKGFINEATWISIIFSSLK